MDSLTTERRRSLLVPGILIALLLVAFAYLDFVLNIWPAKLGEARWRFGTAGVLMSYLAWLLLGQLLLLWFAQMAGSRSWLRLGAALCGLQGLVMLVVLVGFPLDFLQVRRDVADADQWTFKVAAARTVLKLGIGALTFLWLTVTAFRAAKDDPGSRAGRRETSPLIVGQERG
jgi:hypothetical protein